MIIFPCQVCQTPLSADETQAGTLVRCPTCATTLRVPAGSLAPEMAVAGGGPPAPPSHQQFAPNPFGRMAPPRAGGKRYGFNCAHCSSRLEATDSMAAQDGQCPTCGNTITIPILDRYGRLIDPKTQQVIKQDPHPVHAYAAAGDKAPLILRRGDGQQNIQCPRCQSISAITSNNCKSCGMPFTMEGTTVEASGTSNGFCVASLVLGIIGIPSGCLIVPPLLAIIFGIVGFNQLSKSGTQGGGKGMAIAGIICGGIGMLWGASVVLKWF